VTSDPDFKVIYFFDIEYLRNDTVAIERQRQYALYRMVTFPIPNPVFKVTSFLKSNISVHRDKVTIEH